VKKKIKLNKINHIRLEIQILRPQMSNCSQNAIVTPIVTRNMHPASSTSKLQLRRTSTKALTATAVRALKAPGMLSDGALQTGAGRLKIRKRISGKQVITEWLFIWTNTAGKTSSMTLGLYTDQEVEDGKLLNIGRAREKARELQESIKSGNDPALQREIERAAVKEKQVVAVEALRQSEKKTFAALLNAYVENLETRGKSSAYDVKNMFSNHVLGAFPNLASVPASQIQPAHIAQILARLVAPGVVEKKGRTAVKLRAYLAAAFKSAFGAELDPMAASTATGFGLTNNPAAAVPVANMAAKYNVQGTRTLSPAELNVYVRRLAVIPNSFVRVALQLQLATGGQRIEQILRLTSDDITDTTINLYDPKGRRATPRKHVLPVLPEIGRILSELTRINPSGNLFSSRPGIILNPETLSSEVRKISNDMQATGEALTPFRGGDIRRTCETLMAGTLRIHKDVRAQLLSHGIGGVQDLHYDHSDHLIAKIEALRLWNDFLAGLGQEGTPQIRVKKTQKKGVA
jgi:integrase